MIDRIRRWWTRPTSGSTRDVAWEQEFAQKQHEEQVQRVAWLDSLPADLRIELQDLSPSDIDFLIHTAALTPESDRANAVRRWRTLPDQPPDLPVKATINERVEILFTTQLRPDGSQYTAEDVAIAFDGAIDPNEITQIRTGVITKPDPRLVFKIGRFFHVPPTSLYPIMHIRFILGPMTPQARVSAERALLPLVMLDYQQSPGQDGGRNAS